MSNAKKHDVESHKIAETYSPRDNEDEEEVFSDSRSQPPSPNQSPSPRLPCDKSAPANTANGTNGAVHSNGGPASRQLASGAGSEAVSLESKEAQRNTMELDPGEEEVVVKDLDTGRAVTVQRKYTIRDLTTGQLFVVDAQPSSQGAEALSEPGSPAKEGSGLVTDISSGKEMSLEEFDKALGLHTALEAARKQFGPGGLDRSESHGSAAPGGGKSSSGFSKGKGASRWLKRHMPAFAGGGNRNNLSSRSMSGLDSDDSADTRGSPLSMAEGSVSARRNESGTASPSGRAGERQLRVQAHSCLVREFTELCVVQELNAHNGVIWTMKFSKNGKYLASAGQDAAVRVWEVCLNRGEARAGEAGEQPGAEAGVEISKPSVSGAGADADCPVLQNAPHRTYVGHTADVLDLAWSKSQFLLTASMDKTVRLWHISMEDCLRVFKHTDFVTSLDFHPVDDKYFVSGSIDGKVRVWNIPEQRVVDWADVHEMVTATAFSPDGRRTVVGTMKGRCRFYQCEPTFKLEYQAQIDVKNRRGNTARGRKITGMQFLPQDPSQLLITSNDSRVRLYEGFNLRTKYKGHHNRNTQIRATFSQDGAFLVCGSDDGWVHIWPTGCGADDDKLPKQEKSSSYECFHAHNDIVTVALFAPGAARRKLPSRAMSQNLKGRVNRLGLRQKFSKEEAQDATEAVEAIVKSERALGHVILSAGYNGEIKVFENFGCPHVVN